MSIIKPFKCLRCGHSWYPRDPDNVQMCPECKSKLWDEAPSDSRDFKLANPLQELKRIHKELGQILKQLEKES